MADRRGRHERSSDAPSGTLRQHDMSDLLRRNMFGHLVAEPGQVDAGKERLAGAQQDRRDDNVHVVDEVGSQILSDGGHPSAETDIAAAGRLVCLLECGLAIGDEMEDRAASISSDGRAWWVSTKTGT
jgi:hypothetical protein